MKKVKETEEKRRLKGIEKAKNKGDKDVRK